VPKFKALWVEEQTGGVFIRRIVERDSDDLPDGDVLIEVHYSSLNYKDALSAHGNRGVTRAYPHTPGIDAAGVVVASRNGAFREGDPVIVTGRDLGMNTAGGLAGMIRVPADWVVPLPDGLTLRDAMIIGTAGFTAAQSVWRLEEHGVLPGSGAVAVTGATGGVGSFAVALLAHLGYRVAAITGKRAREPWLREIGAAEVLGREEFMTDAARPLLSARWAGAVDCVGGEALSILLRSTHRRGAVTTCGMVAGPELHVSVFPFILRGVNLLGIDSAECPNPMRREVWRRLAGPWKIPSLDALATEIPLEEAIPALEAMIRGESVGRRVVRTRL